MDFRERGQEKRCHTIADLDRQSPSLPPIPMHVGRRRAHSVDSRIYDDDYRQYIHETFIPDTTTQTRPWALSPPDIVQNDDALDESYFKHAYFYAHYRIKLRKVSPRTEHFLKKYKEIASKCIEEPSKENKTRLSTLNEVLHSKRVLLTDPKIRDIDGQQAIIQLMMLKYLANYGDYLAEQCARFREDALRKGLEGALLFKCGNSWTEVQTRIADEDMELRMWMLGGQVSQRPRRATICAIRQACDALELDSENTLFTIKWYANRNETMHSMVRVHITNCDWKALGKQLWWDKRDLSRVIGKEEYYQVKKALKAVEKQYFVHLDPDDPILNEHATALMASRHQKRATAYMERMKEAQRDQASKEKDFKDVI